MINYKYLAFVFIGLIRQRSVHFTLLCIPMSSFKYISTQKHRKEENVPKWWWTKFVDKCNRFAYKGEKIRNVFKKPLPLHPPSFVIVSKTSHNENWMHFWLSDVHQLTFILTFFPLFFCGHWKVTHLWNIRRVSLPIHKHPLSNIFSHSLQLSHSQMLVKRARDLMDSENTEVLCAHTLTQTHTHHSKPLAKACSSVDPCLSLPHSHPVT